MLFMPGWHAAFAAQRYFSRPNAAEAAIGLHRLLSRKIGAGWGGTSRPGHTRPPSGFRLSSAESLPAWFCIATRLRYVLLRLTATVWNSGWDSLNDLTGGSGQIDGRFRKIASDGPYWLYVNLDPSVASPRCLRAELALTLLSEESVTPLPRGAARALPAGGRCCGIWGSHAGILLMAAGSAGECRCPLLVYATGQRAGRWLRLPARRRAFRYAAHIVHWRRWRLRVFRDGGCLEGNRPRSAHDGSAANRDRFAARRGPL